MATQQDIQELLRLLIGVRKLPILQAMAQVKALQAEGLKSIGQVAEAEFAAVERAAADTKAARALQNACKAAVKRGGLNLGAAASGKRGAAESSTGTDSKRAKPDAGGSLFGMPTEMTPHELEQSLALPVDTDETRIAATAVETNRAPLVLAFAVELLRYTMSEQPPSSRLSIAQAVVAANSRSKATSIGIESGLPAQREGWGEGQPKVKVMGREVSVLKRGGYEWKGDEVVDSSGDADVKVKDSTETTQSVTQSSDTEPATSQPPKATTWSTSQSATLKESTFVARATQMTDPSDRKKLFASLMDTYPILKSATHNTWAYRVRQPGTGRVLEESFDDGESGCGNLMINLLRELEAVDTLVVLTRWYGGIMLGPDRWRLMMKCVRGALAERMRLTGTDAGLGGEAVWGLDLEAMRSKSTAGGHGTGVVGMQIHRPEGARNYLLKSFASASPATGSEEAGVEQGSGSGSGVKGKQAASAKKRTAKAINAEKEENLGLLLGALRLVFDSWADHLTAPDLDRRAWSWYTAVRPEVEAGPSGWGAKGTLRLQSILDLRRTE